jgi:hypothetical protein
MLEAKDLQSIGELIDKKLGVKLKENNIALEDGIIAKFDKKFDEMLVVVNDGFTGMQKGFDGLRGEFNDVKGELNEVKVELKVIKEDIKLRPTLGQIMDWGDKKIVALELDMDKVRYLHQDEFEKLPPQREINRALVERGFKEKVVRQVE